MALLIKSTCEPLAHNPDLDAPFAESDIYWRLYREMELYVDGRTNGGSFLVAGHRGSGKTWLVHKAIERLQFRKMEEPAKERGEGATVEPARKQQPIAAQRTSGWSEWAHKVMKGL